MQADKTVAIKLSVALDHPCFVGHFPGDPLVPGALLLQWICDAVECCGAIIDDKTFNVQEVQVFKFLAPVCPGSELEVTVQLVDERLVLNIVDGENNAIGKGKLKVSYD